VDIRYLTIAIPTFNRPDKVRRLCSEIYKQVCSQGLEDRVTILVSDNSDKLSIDDTYQHINRIVYVRNTMESSYDNNIVNLFENCKTDYMWLFGDDDLLEEDAIKNVLAVLDSAEFDLALVPFRQPEELTKLPYQESEIVRSNYMSAEKVDLILQSGKLSSYIFNTKNIKNMNINYTNNHSLGWMHIVVAFDTLLLSKDQKLITLNFFGGRSKNQETEQLEWVPLAFSYITSLLKHPYVKSNTNFLFRMNKVKSYKHAEIILTLYGVTGLWKVKDKDAYVKYARQIGWSNNLFLDPRLIVLFFLLKLNIGWAINLMGLFLRKKLKK
jgi:hypothetical protein